MSDAVRAEIAELRAALADAQRERSEATADHDIDTTFEHGQDEVTLAFLIEDRHNRHRKQEASLKFTWDQLIELLGPLMLDEAAESTLRRGLSQHAWSVILSWNDPVSSAMSMPNASVLDESWGRVLVQLRALGVITTGTKKRTVSDKAVYWTLTTAGDQYLVRLKATKRIEAPS